jgi:hypothetical protein
MVDNNYLQQPLFLAIQKEASDLQFGSWPPPVLRISV